jgi:hypothetical protein
MTPDEAIAIVKSKAAGRTRSEGQEPFLDEVLVKEIERLRIIEEDCPSGIGPCGLHDLRWYAYSNPVSLKSDKFCLFCEIERLQDEVKRWERLWTEARRELRELLDNPE